MLIEELRPRAEALANKIDKPVTRQDLYHLVSYEFRGEIRAEESKRIAADIVWRALDKKLRRKK